MGYCFALVFFCIHFHEDAGLTGVEGAVAGQPHLHPFAAWVVFPWELARTTYDLDWSTFGVIATSICLVVSGTQHWILISQFPVPPRTAVLNQVRSWCLDVKVAVSNPPTAGQLPHLAVLYWPSWEMKLVVILLIKKAKKIKDPGGPRRPYCTVRVPTQSGCLGSIGDKLSP